MTDHAGMNRSTLREMPSEQRPRERLLAHGASALTDCELIAILLRTGHRGCSVLDLAYDLLYDEGRGLGGLPALALLVEHDLPSLRRKGLGDAKAATVLAAVELARRLARCTLPPWVILTRMAGRMSWPGARACTCTLVAQGKCSLLRRFPTALGRPARSPATSTTMGPRTWFSAVQVELFSIERLMANGLLAKTCLWLRPVWHWAMPITTATSIC